MARKKTEAQIASEVFEIYYKMGSKRSLHRLSQELKLDFKLLSNWSDVYGWEELIDARDADVDRRQQRLYKERTLKIRDRLTDQISKLIDSMESTSLGLPFDIRSPNDLRALAQAYQALVGANNEASREGAVAATSKSPKTWSDLLGQSTTDSEVED